MVVRTTAVLVLCWAAQLDAGGRPCRDIHDPSLAADQWVVAAFRDEVATVDLSRSEADAVVYLEGRVCDSAGEILAGVAVTLVKYAATAEARGAPPTAADLALGSSPKYEVIGSRQAVASDRGSFHFLAIDPASYALQVDWRKVPGGASYVVFDLGWTEGVGLRKVYAGR